MTVQDLGGDEDGQTPVDADDAQYLRPPYAAIRTRGELNDAEAVNITEAHLWLEDQHLTVDQILRQSFLRDLHGRMFGDVWTWAGLLRRRDTTIGVPPAQIQERLQVLVGDVRYWVDHATFGRSETAVRFHHQLVFIHPFVNGNGRHARLAASLLAGRLGLDPDHLSWGARSGLRPEDARRAYLGALRAADQGDYGPLLGNATS